jgi:hypothetical protein
VHLQIANNKWGLKIIKKILSLSVWEEKEKRYRVKEFEPWLMNVSALNFFLTLLLAIRSTLDSIS